MVVLVAAALHHRPGGRAGAQPLDYIVLADRGSTSWRSSSSRWCAMASWRGAGRRRGISRLLHVDVGRRHDRRHRGRADRPACVQLGRRVSDPDRARDPVPAGPLACPRDRSITLRGSASRRSCSSLRAGTRCRIRLDDMYLRSPIGVLLATRACSGATPLPFAAIIALVLFVQCDFYEPDVGGATACAASSACTRSSRPTDGKFRILMHGTTEHGAQQIRDEDGEPIRGRPEPLTYYTTARRSRRASRPCASARTGRSRGGRAGHRQPRLLIQPGDRSPTTRSIRPWCGSRAIRSDSPSGECAPDADRAGRCPAHARRCAGRGLRRHRGRCLPSDAIPIHLLTREAMAIYLKSSRRTASWLMHVSNRHMELASVVAGIADANGLVTLRQRRRRSRGGRRELQVLVHASRRSRAARTISASDMARSEEWEEQEAATRSQWVWTDDYSNIIGAMIRQLRR